ncbi:sugar ABC transporter ATP-binding protein [Arsenicitalea aurantiaca]|uniref:Sugar ABC transporter ATP-binding protein n=1 Tax=Arsenicitalea aurantiaca TaxID=1783274 RepID=A0A433XL76_9HYPH|nr:sugar ABC transporter ATP-binding protein [Arsenicitalea aurantiaca]RUT34830.1 sugar ABC transporter ATP-binding protein [Arsenicitalea aurantiaca]
MTQTPSAEPSPARALHAQGVTKRFGAITALSSGRISVGKGEIHALLGANGCGKSTLCKIIAGTVSRDGGTLEIDGRPADLKSPREAEALGVALFYQELSLVPQLSVADNIFLGHEPRNAAGFVDRRRLIADTEVLIARFSAVAGSGFAAGTNVSRLSPDQRQIVEILKVLARNPSIIIFDEATAALDKRQVDLFFSILRTLKAEGVAIIFISHRMDEVFEIADRITVMRNGETVAEYGAGEVDRDTVVHDMVGKLADHQREARPPRPAGETPRLVVSSVSGGRLRDVSFSVAPGEILGLGGLQGQGQSAILQGLFGAEPFARGEVSVDGRPVRLRRPADAIRAGLAYVSGDRGRDAALHGRSIFENIAAATLVSERRRFVWPSALKPRFEKAAAGLNTKYAGMEAPIGSLSGGNQQKIFIARWLATDASILLLDDPTKGIDLGAKGDFFELARDLAAKGTSIVFYASEDAELLGLCDRILVFNSGAVTAELSGDTRDAFHLTRAAYGETA